MHTDEQAIRDLIETWGRATLAGDLPQLLALMADDVVFLQPGQPPMRKEDFATAFQSMLPHVRIEPKSNVREVQVEGNLAYCWNHLTVIVTPQSGGPMKRRSGFTLTILRKQPDGRWVISRDANMLTLES